MNSFEPFVNTELIDKIRRARERTFDEDLLTEEQNIEEERHLSELWRRVMNYDENELILCVAAALQKIPDKVYQVLAEDRDELLRKGKRKDE